MFTYVRTHKLSTGTLGLILCAGSYFAWHTYTSDPLAGIVTETIDRGTVQQLITVSGFIEAKNTADLGFMAGGTLESVNVTEGELVTTGHILARLDDATIRAERAQAVAARAAAISTRDELLAGPSIESRAVVNKTVAIAKAELQRITTIEQERVMTAARTLRSAGLFATSDKADEDALAPSITGTYTCQDEGDYVMTIYNSGSDSGYSMTLSGLETGTFTVSTDQDIPFGTCGLRAKFTEGARYSGSVWTVEIPNTKSAVYTANKNAYELAKTTAANAVAAANQAVSLAELEQTRDNAAPRSEAVARATANISEADARISQIDAQLADLTLTAPFAGTITTVAALKGEIVTAAPIIKLVGSDQYVLKARIPEIDITDIALGQSAHIIFDARDAERFDGTVTYISPAATEISGVTYYETELTLSHPPVWLRGGLNADVEIVIREAVDTIRVPRRFIMTTDDTTTLLTLVGSTIATSTVEVTLFGNDGFAAITGLTVGDTVVAP